jgi:hypothetical protein
VLEGGAVGYDGPPTAEHRDADAHHHHGRPHSGGLPRER